MNLNNGEGSWEENRKVLFTRTQRLENEVATLTADVSKLKEERGQLFSEIDNLNECVKKNTEGVGKNDTRLAVLALKITMLGLGGGVGGGVGTVLVKALMK